MKILYVDNFRGFQKTYIPICDVNFLIGDNSTGKTSILALINLLSSDEFWRTQNFNLSEYEFGDFKGVCNNKESSASFVIGYFETDNKLEKNKPGYATILVFCNKENLPIIKAIYRVDKRGELRFIYNKGKGYYKYLPPTISNMNEVYLNKIFSSWLVDIKNPDLYNYQRISESSYWYSRKNVLYSIGHLYYDCAESYVHKSPIYPSLFKPYFCKNFSWIGPIRSKPKRTYESYKIEFTPEGDHIPKIIYQFLRRKKYAAKFLSTIEPFGKESKLFDSLQIKSLGKGNTSPFELRIVIDGESRKISDVGYGVSQALPIVVEFLTRNIGSSIAVQQPEVHLHPKAQAALGQVVYSMASIEKKVFFIETHSDYLIDRFRIIRSKESTNNERFISSQVLFFKHIDGICTIFPIAIDTDGHYSECQPKEFRDFFLNEQLELLSL